MKYVVMREENGKEEIFLFSGNINHDCFAEGVRGLKNQTQGNWKRQYRFAVSAGFVTGNKCHGISESLGIESRPEEDTELLRRL